VNQVRPTLTAAGQAQPHSRNSSSMADDRAMAKQDSSVPSPQCSGQVHPTTPQPSRCALSAATSGSHCSARELDTTAGELAYDTRAERWDVCMHTREQREGMYVPTQGEHPPWETPSRCASRTCSHHDRTSSPAHICNTRVIRTTEA
jgi:hypothetical protein